MESSKRRKIHLPQNDFDTPYIAAPSTSRTAAKAAAIAASLRAATVEALKLSGPNAGNTSNGSFHIPLLDLKTLPPEAIQRYLSRYGLLGEGNGGGGGGLSYCCAVFPTPPLAEVLSSPLNVNRLDSEIIVTRRSKPLDLLNHEFVDILPTTTSLGSNSGGIGAGGSKKRSNEWFEPKMKEFKNVTAFDEQDIVVNRLAEKAKVHWDKRDAVKEGETLTNFMFALRMRGS